MDELALNNIHSLTGYSLMFFYIHIISYYKLFLYFSLCLSVMLDSLSCTFTFISFLTKYNVMGKLYRTVFIRASD